ncbi:MAG TPA: efflux RND transporter periplasmic adaptor subunit [Bryobacteraceae bacterium]
MWKCRIMAFAIFVATLLSGCNKAKSSAEASTEAAALKPGLFAVTKDQIAHLKVATVQRSNWSISVRTTGTVDWDADHTTQAITQVTGPISRILVDTGAVVKAGDPLLYVSSPDVAAAIATYKKARNQQDLAKRALDRSKELLDRGAIAQKDMEGVEATYNDASTDVQNALEALKIFAITKPELDQAERQGVPISPELAVRSPIAGMIVQKMISPGMLVQAGQTVCFMVSDVGTVWVQGHIFDRDLASVTVGDRVDETNASIPNVFHGVVSYIGSMVDTSTRTTPVRIVTPNPRGLLKKDTFVDAVIHTRSQTNVLSVPLSSVLRTTENEPFVYVEVEPGKFAQRLITTGAEQDGRAQVLTGLKEGERIVSEGSLFLQFANSNR